MGFFKRDKTRNRLAKHDLEEARTALEYINESASVIAGLAAKYHKRYLMEGSEKDHGYMAICDTTTKALKEAYEILYQIVESKDQEITEG
tara:strand:- start:1224 stop:1493 length:270 start_codon:yes stop_codon:yes gene_type:complete